MAKDKPPKVREAEITEDGCIIISLNHKIWPHTDKVLLTPELILELTKEYGDIPPSEFNDYPGVPVIDVESVFADEEDDDESGDKKPTDKKSDEEE